MHSLSVAAASDGSVVVGSAAGPPSRASGLVELKLLALPGRVPATWGAIDNRSFARLRRGAIVVRSSIAGRATVTLMRGQRAVAHASAAIEPGTTVLHVRPAPPRGEYLLRLDVDGALGSFSDRTTVITLRRLSLNRARRAAEERVKDDTDGDSGASVYTAVDACARRTGTRVDCRLLRIEVGFDEDGEVIGRSSECSGRLAVSLAPDGIHTRFLEGCRLPGQPQAAGAARPARLRAIVSRYQK